MALPSAAIINIRFGKINVFWGYRFIAPHCIPIIIVNNKIGNFASPPSVISALAEFLLFSARFGSRLTSYTWPSAAKKHDHVMQFAYRPSSAEAQLPAA